MDEWFEKTDKKKPKWYKMRHGRSDCDLKTTGSDLVPHLEVEPIRCFWGENIGIGFLCPLVSLNVSAAFGSAERFNPEGINRGPVLRRQDVSDF